MKTDLNWHRHHQRIHPMPEPYPWRRIAFAAAFVALVLLGTCVLVVL